MAKFLIMSSKAKMPSSCWGGNNYHNLALVELDPDWPTDVRPAMISTRARGIKKIIEFYPKLFKGKTEKSEYYKVLAELQNQKKGMESKNG